MSSPPDARALELRVHGVSGTPPEELLDRPLVEQVLGDKIAGFYRPRLPAERRDSQPSVFAPERADAAELVGYSWGGLTSGSPARALWLLLLPFTLINVAPRARPARAADCGAAEPAKTATSTWAIWYLCRLVALALTILLVLAGIGIGEDLIGWQCSQGTTCRNASPAWLFRSLSNAHHLSAEHMLLVGALVPTVLLSLLWVVSTRTANRYERTVVDVSRYRAAPSARDDDDTDRVELGLSSRLMWRNSEQVRRLRAIHLQCGFAVIVWSLLAPSRVPVFGLVPAALVGYGVAVLAFPKFTGHGTSTAWRAASAAVWVVLGATAAVAVGGLAFDARWIDGSSVRTDAAYGRLPVGGLPRFAATVLGDCAAAIGVLVVLSLVVIASAWRGRAAAGAAPPPYQRQRQGLGGLTTGAFAALAVFLAAGFASGAYVFAAGWLTTGSLRPNYEHLVRALVRFRVPATIDVASEAYAVAIYVLVAWVLIWVVVVAVQFAVRPGYATQVQRDYPAAGRQRMPAADAERRRTQIQRDMFLGGLVDKVPRFVGPLILAGLLIVAVAIAVLVHDAGLGPQVLRGVGAYLAVLTVVGLVAVGALAFRVRSTRRVVGILWDVASFWPRSAHPLAAPCYAERTVPDLVTYLTERHIEQPDDAVVLAAHSQGTVISAATILQLKAFDELAQGRTVETCVLPKLGFLSFGCVPRRLYGRYFPVYFGPARLSTVQDALGGAQPRWRNLWRYTDYLGGQVTDGPPQGIPPAPAPLLPTAPASPPTAPPVYCPNAYWEWHSPDPPYFDRLPGDTALPAPHRHSDFWLDASGYFQLAVADLVNQVDGLPTWQPPTSQPPTSQPPTSHPPPEET